MPRCAVARWHRKMSVLCVWKTKRRISFIHADTFVFAVAAPTHFEIPKLARVLSAVDVRSMCSKSSVLNRWRCLQTAAL